MLTNKRMCFCLCQQRATQARVDISNCPLCFRFITVWGKRWNFAHLFHCCTTYSMSLSLRCWSFDLIFTGSWRLSTYMVTNFLQILQLFFASFLFQSAQIRQIICDCFSDWINTWLTRNSRSLKKSKFSFSLHLLTVTSFGEDSLLIHCIVNKHCREEQCTLKF